MKPKEDVFFPRYCFKPKRRETPKEKEWRVHSDKKRKGKNEKKGRTPLVKPFNPDRGGKK